MENGPFIDDLPLKHGAFRIPFLKHPIFGGSLEPLRPCGFRNVTLIPSRPVESSGVRRHVAGAVYIAL